MLKPGGHLAAFSAPKSVHKMGVAIEEAGFEVRDRIINFRDLDPALEAFLDSLSVAQADSLFMLLDHFGGLGEAFWCFGTGFPKSHNVSKALSKISFGAASLPREGVDGRSAFSGAQKRDCASADSSGSEAINNFEGWGTALKPAYEPIIIARKPIEETSIAAQCLKTGTGAINIDAARVGERFPANLAHDGSAAAMAGFDSRFFYSGKADGGDRLGSGHPTVKPVDLMAWLCRMLCPKGGLILDPFAGTGTTGEAAYREGMSAVLIEQNADYQTDITRRMKLLSAGPQTRAHESAKAKAARRSGIKDEGEKAPIDLLNMMGGQKSEAVRDNS